MIDELTKNNNLNLPILCDPPKRVWTPNEFVKSFHNRQEHRSMGSFFLPAV